MCCIVNAAHFIAHGLIEWSEFEMHSKATPEMIRRVFEKEIGSFGALRKKWCIKLAKEVSQRFNVDLSEYKSVVGFRSSVDAF